MNKSTYQYRRKVPGKTREELYRFVETGDRLELRRWHNADSASAEPGLVAAFDPVEVDAIVTECGGLGKFVECCIGAGDWENAVARGRPRSAETIGSDLLRRYRRIYRKGDSFGK